MERTRAEKSWRGDGGRRKLKVMKNLCCMEDVSKATGVEAVATTGMRCTCKVLRVGSIV